MPERARTPRGHQAAWLAVALLCTWSAWRGGVLALRPGAASDLRIYWQAGRAVLDRSDPYEVTGFLYLPAFAVAMVPFAALPFTLVVVLWQSISLGATLWAARACRSLVARDGLVVRPWLAWAPLLVVSRLADSNLGNGQVNAVVFALLLLGVGAWMDGRDRSAGTWVGLATALKLVPGCIVLAMAARRSWKAVVATAAATAVFVLLAPSLVLGLDGNLVGIATWWREQVHPWVEGGPTLLRARGRVPGQSLTAVAHRLLDPAEVAWIVRGAQAAYLALLAATLARTRKRALPGGRTLEVSLVLSVALTIAPLVHKAHLLWLLLPYTVLLARGDSGLRDWLRILRRSLIGGSILMIGATSPALLGPFVARWLASHNLIFFGAQLVLAALLLDAWAGNARTTGTRTSP